MGSEMCIRDRDSIQTLYNDALDAAAGSVSQVKDCTLSLMQVAKGQEITVFVIGHVNKALSHILPKDDSEFRHTRLYKGELLALRAFLHFEMARIFAVSFASGDAAAKAKAIPVPRIPPYTKPTITHTAIKMS